MDGIPAASIAGVNLDRIREHHPDSAREIERIGRSLVAGTETEHELLQLCELLFRVGEKRKAEELLLPNAKDGDVLHDLYRRLFGSVAEENYQNALKAFSSDFGVILARIR